MKASDIEINIEEDGTVKARVGRYTTEIHPGPRPNLILEDIMFDIKQAIYEIWHENEKRQSEGP